LERKSSTIDGYDWTDWTAKPRHRARLQHFERCRLEGKSPRPKTRELIALAVAVTLRCDGCITAHTDAAIEQSASKEEISEALGMAVSINTGATLVYSARVLDAYQAHAASAAVPTK